jgi:hypothetical protein
MNRTAAANALNKIAEGIVELGLALEDIPEGVVREIKTYTVPNQIDAPLPSFDELPPVGWETYESGTGHGVRAVETAPAPSGDALGLCPVHRTAWTVKAGGVSKAGKPYSAFWKCSGKNPDNTYCDQKPVKVWADSHPIGAAAA